LKIEITNGGGEVSPGKGCSRKWRVGSIVRGGNTSPGGESTVGQLQLRKKFNAQEKNKKTNQGKNVKRDRFPVNKSEGEPLMGRGVLQGKKKSSSKGGGRTARSGQGKRLEKRGKDGASITSAQENRKGVEQRKRLRHRGNQWGDTQHIGVCEVLRKIVNVEWCRRGETTSKGKKRLGLSIESLGN